MEDMAVRMHPRQNPLLDFHLEVLIHLLLAPHQGEGLEVVTEVVMGTNHLGEGKG